MAAFYKLVSRLQMFSVYALEFIFGLSMLSHGVCVVGLLCCYVFCLRFMFVFRGDMSDSTEGSVEPYKI